MQDPVAILLGDINKRAKDIKASVPAFRLSENSDLYKGKRIATGSPMIDQLLFGGVPCGRVVELFGGEASGKTTTALTIIAGAIRSDPNVIVVFIDAENALDLDYAKRVGLDPSKVIIQQPDWGEQCLELVKQACLAKIENPTLANQQLVVVVDSVAALVPKEEFDQDGIGDSGGMARQAAMMSRSMRQLVTPINKADACAIFINQTRENIGNTYGGHTTPGGRALKFYSSLRLKLARVGKWPEGEGNKIKIEVAKSKMFPPFKSTEIYIGPNGIDNWMGYIEQGVELGVLKKSGAWIKFGDSSIGQGFLKARDNLKTDRELAQKFVNAIAAAKASDQTPKTQAVEPVQEIGLAEAEELLAS